MSILITRRSQDRHSIALTSRWLAAGTLILAMCSPASANISSSFGLSFLDQGYVSTPNGLVTATGDPNDITKTNVQNLQQLSYSDSFALSFDGGTSVLSGSINGTQLHAYSVTSLPTGPTYNGITRTALSGVVESWSDTFNFLPGMYKVNLVLDGSTVSSAPNPLLDENALSFYENGIVAGVAQGGTSQSVTLSFSSPTSVVLSETLRVGSYIAQDSNYLGGSITIDDSHTAYFTIDPLTSGAGFTTASGQTYSAADTPEPGFGLILGGGLVGLFLWRRGFKSGLSD